LLGVRPVVAGADTRVPEEGQTDGPQTAEPEAPLACDPDGVQASGAIYRICMPALLPWNGDLVVFAHGYVPPTEPVGIPEDQMTLPGGISIADVVTLLGYGFATTSYSTNGLAVREGLADLVDVVDLFVAEKGVPETVYLVGASEGGLITVLAVEQRPEVFDGGLALCGPYGDFHRQTDHFGDFRVVFDYFFPGLMPGSPVHIPDWLLDGWDAFYEATVRPQIQDPANAGRVAQLLSVTQAAYDPAEPSTQEEAIYDLLRYNVFATNDAGDKLGGQPYDNQDRIYSGSLDDGRLNADISRFQGDPAALDEIEAYYQTSGRLTAPLVTLHTTLDPIVPYWHATLYRAKVIAADNVALHEHFIADGYGHCLFTSTEVLGAFNRMVDMVQSPPAYEPVFRQYLPLADLVWR
jgi:pimeloyl-ACP methyl ester carboxylesterase